MRESLGGRVVVKQLATPLPDLLHHCRFVIIRPTNQQGVATYNLSGNNVVHGILPFKLSVVMPVGTIG
jgi:hypothetical protein